jgi:diketogulonate reductase-like aldo/keto reductase
MRYEDLHGVRLPKVGFGTWSIGGRETADHSQDARSLEVLGSALAIGYTHFDTAETYAAGHCERLLGRAIRVQGIDRATLFITSKVKPENLAAKDVLKACDGSLKRLDTSYIDLYLVHWPNRSVPLEDPFKALNELRRSAKIRNIGVSNFDLALLKKAKALCETPLLTNQVPMSLFERSYVRNGVLDYCQNNGILLTAYSPVKHARLRKDPVVTKVAATRGLTPSQVGIAWLCSQPCVITIPMSANAQHQRENIAAADVVLTPQEMRALA